MEKQRYLGFHSNIFDWQCSFFFNCHVLHSFSTAMSYITSPTFLSAFQEPKKMEDDHLGYPHRKPPSKPLLASGKLSLLLAICIWVRWITSQKWWFSHVFFVRLPEGKFYGCFSQRCRFLAMAWAEENTPPITDMIVLSSTCYWITRNCSKGELHFEQSLAMKNPCVWWWKTQLWSTLDAIPFLVGLNPNFSRWNPIFSGPLPVPFFPAAPTKKNIRARWQGTIGGKAEAGGTSARLR